MLGNKAYKEYLNPSTKFIDDSIGVDLDKQTTIDHLITMHNEIVQGRLDDAVSKEWIRITELIMQGIEGAELVERVWKG